MGTGMSPSDVRPGGRVKNEEDELDLLKDR